jgi:hypothetical protein
MRARSLGRSSGSAVVPAALEKSVADEDACAVSLRRLPGACLTGSGTHGYNRVRTP